MRRFFYDVLSGRQQAEALLVVSDLLAIAAPVFFTTGILHRSGQAADVVLLLLWLAIPRALARCLAWVERPTEPAKLYGLSLLLVAIISVLTMTGWELVFTEAKEHLPIGFGTAGLILIAWISGLFLFQPHAYKLYDFLCGAVVLLGLMENKPDAWAWIPLFFLALFSSASIRHLLVDVARVTREPTVNLQNARVLTLAATLVASGLFFSSFGALSGGFDFPQAEDLRSRPVRSRFASDLVAYYPNASFSDPQEFEAGGRTTSEGSTDAGRRPRQFSYRINIASVGNRPEDPRVAWTVRLDEKEGGRPGLWPPPSVYLWRAATFSTFDAETSSWLETEPLVEKSWPADGRLVMAQPHRLNDQLNEPPLHLQYEVRIPVFKSLLSLYRPLSFEAKNPRAYKRNGAGDIFPIPPISQGFVYHANVQSLLANHFPDRTEAGTHPDRRRFLSLPPEESLGVDFAELSDEIAADKSAPIVRKIAALKRYFNRGGFRYARYRVWTGRTSELGEFLEEARVGNCAHYATAAALLLRAAAVSTRLAVGFLGGEWNQEEKQLDLRILMAHAWVEVYFPNTGWLALDVTHWIPSEIATAPRPGAWSDSLSGLTGPQRSGASDRNLMHDLEARSLTTSSGASPPRDSSSPHPNTLRFGDGRTRSTTSRWEEMPLDDEYSDWFEFGDPYFDETESVDSLARAAVEELENDAFETSPNVPYGQAETAAPAEESSRQRLLFSRLLRILLVVVAAGVTVLVIVTYKIAKKRAEEEEAKEEQELAEDGLLSHGARATTSELFPTDTPSGKIIGGYQKLQLDLARTRNHRQRHQTPLEHSLWLSRRFQELGEPLHTVARLLYRVLYGRDPVTEDDADAHEEGCRRIRKFMG